jgi:choline kinase
MPDHLPRPDGAVTVPAVILAAGLGRRIAERTGGGPKALLEVHGRSLLEREIVALGEAGFERVIIVTGHAPERIRDRIGLGHATLALSERWNRDYAVANNIVSMLAAEPDLAGGFCLLNSDIVFDPAILRDVAGRDRGSWLVVDGDEPLGDEEMKVSLGTSGAVARISKRLDPATSVGEFIGISRFDVRGAATLVASARRLVDSGRTDIYYEDAIDACLADLGVGIVWTQGRAWTEIDDEVDYQRAEAVARSLDLPAA